MTLFDDLKKVAVPQKQMVELEEETTVEPNVSAMKPLAEETQQKEGDINFADAISNLAAGSGEETAISGIMALTRADDGETPDCNLAMKSVVTNAGAFTAGQWMANYNDALGMPMVADALRMLCKWHYTHNSALKGDRATKAFNALNEEKQKEFLLQKEANAMVPH